MALVGINYEQPIDQLIRQALSRGLVQSIEIVPDTYIFDGYNEFRALVQSFGVPYSFHFTGMSLGSADLPHKNDFDQISSFLSTLRPMHISDHLTCCRSSHIDLRQNLDLPRNSQTVRLLIDNLKIARKRLRYSGPILIEQIPEYCNFSDSKLTAMEFYLQVVEGGDAQCLLDLHNLYTDEVNHGLDATEFIDRVPPERIKEIHMAGGTWSHDKKMYLDSHEAKIPPRVYELLERVLSRSPHLKTIILERITHSRYSPAVERGIWKDLETINEINDKWKRKNARKSSKSRRVS